SSTSTTIAVIQCNAIDSHPYPFEVSLSGIDPSERLVLRAGQAACVHAIISRALQKGRGKAIGLYSSEHFDYSICGRIPYNARAPGSVRAHGCPSQPTDPQSVASRGSAFVIVMRPRRARNRREWR